MDTTITFGSEIPFFGTPGLKQSSDSKGVKDSAWFQVANLGTNVLTSILQYKTLNNQINHGQTPSVAVDQKGQQSGQPVGSVIGGGAPLSLGNWIVVIGLLLLVVVIFKAFK